MQFWSVLGAIAFALLTRVDIAVFVSALQRHSHKPLIIHCKRLNSVVRWAQRNPKRIRYRRFTKQDVNGVDTHLRMYSDAAFKKEEEDGHSMRGALYIRCEGNHSEAFQGGTIGHLVDYQCRSQKKVVRATFTAELLSGCDTVDHGFLLAQTFHEIATGEMSAQSGRTLRDSGGYKVPMILYLDAMSVYAAITAAFQKIPADQSVLCHCLYLRELLNSFVLKALAWLDTRDMLADGLTKGSIDRDSLHEAMDGKIEMKNAIKIYEAKGKNALAGVSPEGGEMPEAEGSTEPSRVAMGGGFVYRR